MLTSDVCALPHLQALAYENSALKYAALPPPEGGLERCWELYAGSLLLTASAGWEAVLAVCACVLWRGSVGGDSAVPCTVQLP